MEADLASEVAPAQQVEALLRLGDSALVLSHRLSELTGKGPALEEDLALANVALDLLGQAQFWLGYAGEIEGRGQDADALAFRRDAGAYRNFLLTELPNGDFAQVMVRQFLFDTWHYLTLDRLKDSVDPRVAGIAGKGLKEVSYHLERSGEWMLRLGDGTAESHRRAQTALDDLWAYTGELFEADATDAALVAAGFAPDPTSLRVPWEAHVGATLGEATLTVPPSGWMQRGGRRGVHTEHLGYLLAEMQFLQRAYPGAKW